jgi:hypothetical protein
MQLEEILISDLFNKAFIALELYPDKKPATAKTVVYMKLNKINGNKFSEEEKQKILSLIKNITDKLPNVSHE